MDTGTDDILTKTPPAPLPARPPLRHRAILWAVTVALIVIFAARVFRFETLNLQKDEVWSVWITLGDLRQTLEWVGYDWPPGHFILLHVWRGLTGISPFSVRVSTVLTMLILAALIFRIGRRLFGAQAGLMVMLAFSGFGYVVFLSTITRGYLLNFTLWAAAFLQMLYFFDGARPVRWRAILLGVTLAGTFYVHNTAVLGMGMIALYSLIAFARRPVRRWLAQWFGRWLLPGAITALLCLPEALSKLDVLRLKRDIVERFIPYQPPDMRLINHYLDYFGAQPALWAAFFVIAAALLLEGFARRGRRILALVVWMLMPCALLWFTWNIDAFQARHLAWVMIGFALWIGGGLALLPRPAVAAAAVVMLAVGFDRLPLTERYEAIPRLPFVSLAPEFRAHYRGGDALLLDMICAGCIPIDAEEWDYFSRASFPEGLPFITPAQIADYPRVWWVTFTGHGASEIETTLGESRALAATVSDSIFTFRRYDRPPDPAGVRFENGMRFHGAELLNDGYTPLVWREGDTVHIRLWWSAETALSADYSVGVYLWKPEAGGVLAQIDGPPAVIGAPAETSKWPVGRYFVEERTLKLPYPLSTGDYQIVLTVYQWWDQQRVAAPGLNADMLLPAGSVYVKSF